MDIASLVLGIVGVCFSFVPFFNYLLIVPVIVGLVLGIVDVSKKSKIENSKKGMGIAGIVLNSVSVFIIIIWTFFVILLVSSIGSSGIINQVEKAVEEYDYTYNYEYDYDDNYDF